MSKIWENKSEDKQAVTLEKIPSQQRLTDNDVVMRNTSQKKNFTVED